MLRRWYFLLAGLGLAAGLAGVARALPPLRTAVTDPYTLQGSENSAAFVAIYGAGARFVRLGANWVSVAPVERPAGFAPSNPADPAYRWIELDSQVKQAVAAGLTPILNVNSSPRWASRGHPGASGVAVDPDPVELASFATAAAKRYSGTSPGLPRVRYWELWNEPNISVALLPQFQHGNAASPGIYRGMVNAFADAIHGVSSSNVVIVGGLSPFTVSYPSVQSIGPLRFMRLMLCMSAGAHPHPTCTHAARFDVWSHHPYTTGGPFHHAFNPNDVSLGDLPKMKALLDAARRAHHIVAPHGLGFWVTEFSWDTNPPDPKAVPIALQARWTSEALYQMWRSGVTLATWWLIKDQPYPSSSFQSGLYRLGSDFSPSLRKPTWTAFRFPFVAFIRSGGATVWGRTPTSSPGDVAIQVQAGSGWRTLARLHADANGMFAGSVAAPLTGRDRLRATVGSESSLQFSLTEPPDHPYHAFG